MLSNEQIAHFEAFGFLLLPQLLTPEEVDAMKRESNEIFDEVRGSVGFDGQKRDAVEPFFERRPFLTGLLDDDRIYSIPESLLGPDFFLFATEGNLHVGDTQWHGIQLTNSPPDKLKLKAIKVAFYIDPLNRDSGSLRIIPGSHRRPFADRLQVLWQQYEDTSIQPLGVSGADMPAVALESQPGDIVVFTENVFHGAFGGAPGRHQHALSFGERPKTEAQLDYLRKLYEGWTYTLRPSETFINSDRPRVRRMVSLLVELGFEPLKV